MPSGRPQSRARFFHTSQHRQQNACEPCNGPAARRPDQLVCRHVRLDERTEIHCSEKITIRHPSLQGKCPVRSTSLAFRRITFRREGRTNRLSRRGIPNLRAAHAKDRGKIMIENPAEAFQRLGVDALALEQPIDIRPIARQSPRKPTDTVSLPVEFLLNQKTDFFLHSRFCHTYTLSRAEQQKAQTIHRIH